MDFTAFLTLSSAKEYLLGIFTLMSAYLWFTDLISATIRLFPSVYSPLPNPVMLFIIKFLLNPLVICYTIFHNDILYHIREDFPMGFDGIIVSAAANELSNSLTGGKIEKIYQPEADELVFHIRSKSANHKLYVSASGSHARFHLLSKTLENPQTPFAFCMLLRKHLVSGRIAHIEQKDSERILEISISTINELGFSVNKTLLFEIMGKHSNIILIDANSRKIIDSIKRISLDESRVRQVLPGKEYEYPPAQGKIPFKTITQEETERLCDGPPHALSKNLLQGIQGLSPSIAGRLAGSLASGDLTGASIFSELASMREKLRSDDLHPVVYIDESGIPVDFHVFTIPELEGSCEKLGFESISQCIEHYYVSKTGLNRLKQKTTDLEKAVRNNLDKLYLKKQRLSEDILAAEKSDQYRLYGELLTANLHMLKAGETSVKLLNYYDGLQIQILLDKRFSPSQNAQMYFKKYSKAKTAIKEKTHRLVENDADIRYLESVYAFVENASETEEIEALRNELVSAGYLRARKSRAKQTKSKLEPFQYITSGGLKVMAGKNNKDNDTLTLKTAARTDLWFHTKDIPGSHVILFLDGKSANETDIFEAAQIAAFHSKGKNSENIPVDYTEARYVKKPAGAKPGMVIFTNHKTVYVSPKIPLAGDPV